MNISNAIKSKEVGYDINRNLHITSFNIYTEKEPVMCETTLCPSDTKSWPNIREEKGRKAIC